MKQNLLLIILSPFVCGLSLFAQPTITNSSIPNASTSGSIVILGQGDTIPGASGANVTWDFSNFPDEAGTPGNYIANSASKNGAQFSTADIANEGPMDVGSYFSTSNNKFSISGAITVNMVTVDDYDTDPKELLVTPITFNDVFNETFSGTQVNTVGMFTYDRGGTIRMEADGYGTLILPNITINNALRVYSKIDYSDELGGITVADYTEERYEWYHPSVKGPIVSIVSIEIFSLKTFIGTYRRLNSVGLDENTNVEKLEIYPNPSNGLFNLNIKAASTLETSLSVFDMRGQLVLNQEVVDKFTQVDLSGFPKGIYNVVVNSNQETYKQRVVLQ